MNDKQYTREMIKNLNNRLKTKQEALTFDNTPTEGSVNPVTSEGIKAYADASKGTTYTAGENITISENNVISATDTKFTAGENITISTGNVINNISDISGVNDGENWTSFTIKGNTKEILQGCEIKGNGYSTKWERKTWNKAGSGSLYLDGGRVWTDGENIYYSSGSQNTNQYVLDKNTSTWNIKYWNIIPTYGSYIWVDGDDIYYSYYFNGSRSEQYKLDKTTMKWWAISWKGTNNINGEYIWTDGTNIYCSDPNDRDPNYRRNYYILDRSTSTWVEGSWNVSNLRDGTCVWNDGENIYYSAGSKQYVFDKTTLTWSAKTWNGFSNIIGSSVWTDGEHIYYSYFENIYVWNDGENIYYSSGQNQYQLHIKNTMFLATVAKTGDYRDLKNRVIANPITIPKLEGEEEKITSLQIDNVNYRIPIPKILDGYSNRWFSKEWYGDNTNFSGNYVWSDGKNIYYSAVGKQYVLNKSTSTWEQKIWNGLNSLDSHYIWTDGDNIYYSENSQQYVLNKSTSTWEQKIWNGLNSFGGNNIWTDGENIYYSSYDSKILDKSTSTWTSISFGGFNHLYGEYVWTDGENIYYSNRSTHYVLDQTTLTWVGKTWSGLSSIYNKQIWTDGKNIYYSYGNTQYSLNKSTSTWVAQTWTGTVGFYGENVWSDGENFYTDIATAEGHYYYQLPAEFHTVSVLEKVSETGDYNDLKNKPVIPNDDHLYIYSVEITNGTDIITLTNIQTSELLQSTLTFADLIDLIQVGSNGVGDSYATLQGPLGVISQKSSTQFTLLTEDSTSHTFTSIDTLTITSHLEKIIF